MAHNDVKLTRGEIMREQDWGLDPEITGHGEGCLDVGYGEGVSK